MTMHANELEVSVETVAALVRDQFPRWASHQIRAVASHGTVNALFRIGDDLVARFPLEDGDPQAKRTWLEAEAAAAGELYGRTPFPTPKPVAIGEPGRGYPLPWAVQTWLPGTVATSADLARSTQFARDLARFVSAVGAIDTQGRVFAGTGRGGLLSSQDSWIESCFERSTGLLDVPRLRLLWARLRGTPRSEPDLMTHSDLMPSNLLVDGERLVGVIDVGGFRAADPALDLVAAWHLLDADARATFRAEMRSPDDDWDRGKGWAFAQAIGLVWYYERTNPVMATIGRRTLQRLLDGDPVTARR